jgi:hypothetical protein
MGKEKSGRSKSRNWDGRDHGAVALRYIESDLGKVRAES